MSDNQLKKSDVNFAVLTCGERGSRITVALPSKKFNKNIQEGVMCFKASQVETRLLSQETDAEDLLMIVDYGFDKHILAFPEWADN